MGKVAPAVVPLPARETNLPCVTVPVVRQVRPKIVLQRLQLGLINHTLYSDIGPLIVQRQEQEGWGKRVADDIQQTFPGLSGFSRSNVFRMQASTRGML
ncbi:MAG: DUF1016 family protein [Planctomycetaceae bacterium]|nr:MAG: DUF1016 family protein [Planctomycetaceae bacterium]